MRILYFFAAFVFVACMKDANSGISRHTTEDKRQVFTARLSAQVFQDDHFSLYYTTDGSSNFSTIKPIWLDVKGRPKRQEITFELPENVKPQQLRIDLGNNPAQPPITLHRITLSYGGKALELPGTLIFSYFRPDFTKTEFDATTGVINGKYRDGKRQSPSLYPKEGPLADELEKLYKP